jgi:DNA-binding HxlR family transcriptional regulator
MLAWKDVNKRRCYDQFCGIARALDLVSERWTLLIVRNLMLGPRRYSDLMAELPGITTNLLAARLKTMEADGLITRTEGPPAGYQLTALGAALEPVVIELGRWGANFMDQPRRADTVNPGWGMLSLKRRYRGGLNAVVEFRLRLHAGERRFELAFEEHHLHVKEREAVRPRLVITAPLEAFQAWLFKGVPAADLQRGGTLTVEGDPGVWGAVQGAFRPNDWKGARPAASSSAPGLAPAGLSR